MTIRDIKDITSFKWGTIVDTDPIQLRLDGDESPLSLTPDSLVDPLGLASGDRVRVELSLRKAVIHGVARGSDRLLRLRTTGDASLTSTGHGFQIGPDNGVNLIADNNEIQARNNGAGSQLNFNLEGGNIVLGSTISPGTVSARGYLLQPELPDPVFVMGASTYTITGAANTFTNMTGIVTTFGVLPRALLVQLIYSAQIATTTTASYARIGVSCTGGLTLDAATDGFGNNHPGLTPFSISTEQLNTTGTKFVIVPAGTATNFQFQTMRSAVSGTQIANYAVLQAMPIRWI